MTSQIEFTRKVKDFALKEAGFDLVGISKAELLPLHQEAISDWVDHGFAGSMHYMARDKALRAEPEHILKNAKSVVSLAINYYHPEDTKPEKEAAGRVARYAYGRDYHKVIEKKLKKLSQFITDTCGAGALVKSYVDTGPILEKAFAQNAGLGFFGKNTNLITKKYGSWVFLASLVTTVEFLYDDAHTGSCGSCTLCIDACPTGALLGGHTMDARRCISYLTIESKAEHPAELKQGIGEWIFGCDICQTVCPYNHKAQNTIHEDLFPKKIGGSWIPLSEIENLRGNEELFKKRFEGSPLRRSKLSGLLRNANTARENLCRK